MLKSIVDRVGLVPMISLVLMAIAALVAILMLPEARVVLRLDNPRYVISSDNFSDPSSGWVHGWFGEDEDKPFAGYLHGKYYIVTNLRANHTWWLPSHEVGPKQNVSVEVDTAMISNIEAEPASGGNNGDGDSATEGAGETDKSKDWGVFCRESEQGNEYFLGIRGYSNDSDENLASIWKRDADGRFTSIITDTLPKEINVSEVNRVRGDCVGSTLTLYINGQKLLEADVEGVSTGKVGIFTRNPENLQEGNVVEFDNFAAYGWRTL